MTAVAGAILCGGASSRMGGPKALCVLHDGKTAISHVASAMRAAGLSPVIAVSSSQGPASGALSAAVDAVVLDGGDDGKRGPLLGVATALRHTHTRTVFWPVDMPCVPAQVLRGLAGHDGNAVQLPSEPLCLVLESAMLTAVEAELAEGRTGVRSLLRVLRATTVRRGRLLTWDPAEAWRASFNTPHELEWMNARARECAMTDAAP